MKRVGSGLSEFQKEFRSQLSTFITGAFAFVAALLWKDAIKSYLDRYMAIIELLMPLNEGWVVDLFTALFMTVVAVAAIIIISRILNPKR